MAGLLVACGHTDATPAPPDPSVHTVNIVPDEPPLPDGPGSAEVNASWVPRFAAQK